MVMRVKYSGRCGAQCDRVIEVEVEKPLDVMAPTVLWVGCLRIEQHKGGQVYDVLLHRQDETEAAEPRPAREEGR